MTTLNYDQRNDLWVELEDAVIEVRDNFPRVADDAPTADIIDRVMEILRQRELV